MSDLSFSVTASRLAFLKDNYVTSDHRVAGSSPAGCKSSTIAVLQAINEAEKSLEERKRLPKFCHFLGEPPFFWVCGSEGAEESVQCRWHIVLSLQGCSLRSSKKTSL